MPDDQSIVLKPRELFSDAILPQNADELAKFIDQPLPAIAESITGALAAGAKGWALVAGRIVQGALKLNLFQQVGREIRDLRDKGKIPEDFADEKKYKYGFKSWVELLTSIDEDAPDADRLDAIKAMFYAVNKISATDGERIVNYQLFQIAKRLTSGELLLLKCMYEALKAGDHQGDPNHLVRVDNWAIKIARRMGHNLAALILRDERRLTEEGLISPYVNSLDTRPYQAQVSEKNARLTDLGLKFCGAIQDYESEVVPH